MSTGEEGSAEKPGYSDELSEYGRRLFGGFSSRISPTDWLIILLTLTSAATVGLWFVGWVGAFLSVGAGLAIAAAALVEERETPVARTASGLLVFLGAVLVSGVVAVTATLAGASAILGVVGGVGMYCLVLGVAGSVFVPFETAQTSLSRPLGTALSVASGVVVVFVGESVPRADARTTALGLFSDLLGFAYSLAVSPGPETVVVSFFSLTAVAAFLLSASLTNFPAERLLPPGRSEWKRKLDTLSEYLFVLFAASAVVTVVASVVTFTPIGGEATHAERLRRLPLGGILVSLLANTGVRLLLTSVSAVGLVSVLAFRCLRLFRGGFVRSLLFSRLPVAVGVALGALGGVLLSGMGLRRELLSAVSSFTPENFAVTFGDFSSFALANLAFLLALVALALLLVLLETTRVLFTTSGRAGPTLAAAGLFGFGVAAVLADVFVGGLVVAAVGLFVWDVGSFSRDIRGDLSPETPVARVESVHAAGSFIVISLSTVAAYVLHRLVTPLVTPQDPEVAVLGLVLLVALAFPLVYVLRTS